MDDVHELGGGIVLLGFNALDKDEQYIIKKIVGSYVEGFSNSISDYTSLEVEFDRNGDVFDIKAKLITDSGIIKKVEKKKNVFVGLDKALKEVKKDS